MCKAMGFICPKMGKISMMSGLCMPGYCTDVPVLSMNLSISEGECESLSVGV